MRMSRREMLKAIAAGALLPDLLAGSQNVWAQAATGKQGLALTIGMDSVDPSGYGGWDGRLSGCIADANVYEHIAKQHGFQTLRLRSGQATVAEVTRHILWAAKLLREGDIFFIAYSGHGGRVPDRNGDEGPDGNDETLCLFDRQLIDDELGLFWRYFAPQVRILFVSDSCHSGTVARVVEMAAAVQKDIADPKSRLRQHVQAVSGNMTASVVENVAARAKSLTAPNMRIRGTRDADDHKTSLALFRSMPEVYIRPAYDAQRDTYDGVGRGIRRGNRTSQDQINASGILLAACRDDQLSLEMGGRGVFSSVVERLLGQSPTSYTKLIDNARSLMLPTQQPQLFTFGENDQQFAERQQPFTI